MGVGASQITSVSIVSSSVCSGTDQSKLQSSASLAFVRGIHRGPVNSPHKGPVTRKMSPFDCVIMGFSFISAYCCLLQSSLSSRQCPAYELELEIWIIWKLWVAWVPIDICISFVHSLSRLIHCLFMLQYELVAELFVEREAAAAKAPRGRPQGGVLRAAKDTKGGRGGSHKKTVGSQVISWILEVMRRDVCSWKCE